MKKNVIITLLVAVSLAVALFTIILVGGQSVEYDPWIDVNDDGKIDMKDIGQVARAFGATGTAINKTALLLELQEGLEELNATVDSLEQRVSSLEGSQTPLEIVSESVNAFTDPADGTLTVSFPGASFTSAPDIIYCHVVLREAAGAMPKGALAFPNLSSITATQFDVEVVEHRGSSTTINGKDVTIIYLAINM